MGKIGETYKDLFTLLIAQLWHATWLIQNVSGFVVSTSDIGDYVKFPYIMNLES